MLKTRIETYEPLFSGGDGVPPEVHFKSLFSNLFSGNSIINCDMQSLIVKLYRNIISFSDIPSEIGIVYVCPEQYLGKRWIQYRVTFDYILIQDVWLDKPLADNIACFRFAGSNNHILKMCLHCSFYLFFKF